MDDRSFKHMSKTIVNTRFNWIDTLIIAVSVGFIVLLKYLFFGNLGRFDVALNAFFIFPAFILIFKYITIVRPKIFSNKKLNFLLLLPKDVENRADITILGLFSTAFQWIGCMLIITSPIWGPFNVDELKLSSDKTIRVKAHREADRMYLLEQIRGLASAKPVKLSDLTPIEAHQALQQIKIREEDPEKFKKEQQQYKKNFIDNKAKELFPSLKKTIHAEERKDYEEKISFGYSQFFRFLFSGMMVLFFGAVIDKINNLIQLKKVNDDII